MSRWAWVIGTLVAGVVTLVVAAKIPTEWGTPLSAGLLAATLIAIVWYSWETHRLVRLQRIGTEVENHPWLSALYVIGSDVPVEESPYGGHEAMLPISNVGRTPARVCGVTVSSRLEEGAADCTVVPGGDRDSRVLVAGGRVNVKVVDIVFRTPTPKVGLYLDVVVEYETLDGGGGRLTLPFRYANRRWKNRGGATYEYTLPSGGTFPRAATRE
jgi:hypothetical protein